LRSMLDVFKNKHETNEAAENQQYDESSMTETDDVDPEIFSDPVLEELESKLLATTDRQNIEEMRLLSSEVQQHQHEASDEMGGILYQML
uniref:hypothetical protein n=1 Tax=Salmonella sp. s51933 TaxID=3160127 RepID=UPI003754F8F1